MAETADDLVAKFRTDIQRSAQLQLTNDRILKMAGHHMCRRVGQPAAFLRDLEQMAATGVPFDTDCVDERLVATAFDVTGGYNDDLQLLEDKSLILPLVLQNREEKGDMPCIKLRFAEGDETAEESCEVGKFNGKAVTFPDVFDTVLFSDWLKTGLSQVEADLGIASGTSPLVGLRLHNIRPTNEDTRGQNACPGGLPGYLPRGIDLSGLPCLGSRLPSINASLFTVHSRYSRDAVAAVSRLSPNEDAVLYKDVASMWMNDMAVFLGSREESTWEGMARYTQQVSFISPSLRSEPAFVNV